MTLHTTEGFRKCFAELPEPVRNQARNAYKRFIQNPYHDSLHFKTIHTSKRLMSVRIGKHYRALGVRDDDDVVWFWIGYHSDYGKLLARL